MNGRPFAIGGPQVKVRVTDHDVAWAVRDDSSRCMVARAIAREVSDATRKESKEGRVAPPRVFKTRSRTYGHRVLRINQPMQPTALDEAS